MLFALVLGLIGGAAVVILLQQWARGALLEPPKATSAPTALETHRRPRANIEIPASAIPPQRPALTRFDQGAA